MDRLLSRELQGGCRRAVGRACPSLSLGMPSPAHSAGLEVTKEENWEDDC